VQLVAKLSLILSLNSQCLALGFIAEATLEKQISWHHSTLAATGQSLARTGECCAAHNSASLQIVFDCRSLT